MHASASPLFAILVSAAIALISTSGTVQAQTVVTTCGQVIVGDGVLTNDLDCSAHPGPSAVVLSTGGRLDLASFTLYGPLAGEAVRCDDDCTVAAATASGGALVLNNGAAGVAGVVADPGRLGATLILIRIEGFAVGVRAHKPVLSGVEMVNNTRAIASLNSNNSPAKILIRNSVMRDNGVIFGAGNVSKGSIRIYDSWFEDNMETALFNARSYRATIKDSRVVRNLDLGTLGAARITDTDILDTEYRGLRGVNKIRARGGEISGNGVTSGVPGFSVALSADFVKVRDVVMNGNLTAVGGDSIRVRDATIVDSVVDGVSGRIVRVTKSSVVGSGRYGIRARSEEEFLGQDRNGKVDIKGTTVTGSGVFGVIADGEEYLSGTDEPNCVLAAKAAISDSNVTGNGTDAECGATLTCADLAACDPALVKSADVCDASYLLESGVPGASLGVCALD